MKDIEAASETTFFYTGVKNSGRYTIVKKTGTALQKLDMESPEELNEKRNRSS